MIYFFDIIDIKFNSTFPKFHISWNIILCNIISDENNIYCLNVFNNIFNRLKCIISIAGWFEILEIVTIAGFKKFNSFLYIFIYIFFQSIAGFGLELYLHTSKVKEWKYSL